MVIEPNWRLSFESLAIQISEIVVASPIPRLLSEICIEASRLHVLELLEITALENIKLILHLPESKGILTIDEVGKRLLTSKSAFLVDT